MADATPSYTIPETVLAAHLEGEVVLLEMESKQYFRLDGTGAEIWKALEEGTTTSVIVRDLCETFEVQPEEAATEVERLLTELTEAGLVAAEDDG